MAPDNLKGNTHLLTEEEVRHVAMLARLGLSDEEVEMMRVQLPDVLTYIAMLEKVDTSHIAPTAQMIAHQNVMRHDEPRPSWPVQDILSNAPATEDSFFRVPAVLEEVREDAQVTQQSAPAGDTPEGEEAKPHGG
jgi:aspartyl-tRNA(Asn)/glutamyl-tRNA(Gln) amidotransferase subunit C